MRTGYLGGSFDPIHLGHLVLAEAARVGAGLDRVVLVVAAAPPHKTRRKLAPVSDRIEMARRAVAGHSPFSVDDRETRRAGPSFTIETVRALLAEAGPDDEVVWIIGSDSLADLPDWREGPTLVDLVDVVSAARPGHDVEAALAYLVPRLGPERVERLRRGVVPMPEIGISATDVRARVRAGRSIRFLVPEPVRERIREAGLYRD